MRRGIVYIVGAGPGDPGLITVRGLELVRRADAIVYDRLAPREILGEARPDAELYYVGKEPGRHAASQNEINRLLEKLARRGLKVVRLHGGDPLTYGRGEEECVYLALRGVRCEVVPGVPSFTAAASAAMAPLAGRGFSSVFTVATAIQAGGQPLSGERLAGALRVSDSLVILMGAGRLADIARAFSALDPSLPIVIVERAFMPGQRVIDTTAAEAASGSVRAAPPAVIIAGSAARWRLKWLEIVGGAGRSY
jgi:uroporphyrin-III C-methyltransferase